MAYAFAPPFGVFQNGVLSAFPSLTKRNIRRIFMDDTLELRNHPLVYHFAGFTRENLGVPSWRSKTFVRWSFLSTLIYNSVCVGSFCQRALGFGISNIRRRMSGSANTLTARLLRPRNTCFSIVLVSPCYGPLLPTTGDFLTCNYLVFRSNPPGRAHSFLMRLNSRFSGRFSAASHSAASRQPATNTTSKIYRHWKRGMQSIKFTRLSAAPFGHYSALLLRESDLVFNDVSINFRLVLGSIVSLQLTHDYSHFDGKCSVLAKMVASKPHPVPATPTNIATRRSQ
ncbi:hypothetical protein P3T76_013520 [Phytophthora citrophthora]|uniref:Uncharacterized protein n=1 Tax=Phytophthora citrophthora TaxID=4793 RepID=A0AAD9G2I4_9STRA|nr:hypothetical protein P3T76_013520 [Phytophthora citrophthora]